MATSSQSRSRFDSAQLAEWIELACLIEATARKPGNVHPGAAFADLTYDDFVAAARISAPILADAQQLGVGRAVLEAVQATVAETGTNVNLGICLLIAPLAAAPRHDSLKRGVKSVLMELNVEDARQVYRAIRLANPGGLGDAPEQDVREEPTQSLLDVMRLAADRDDVAAAYADGYREVLMAAEWWPRKFLHDFHQHDQSGESEAMPDWEFLTIGMQLTLLMMNGDTLIRRKCGDPIDHEAACRAEFLLKQGSFSTVNDLAKLSDFDFWLREDGHRRNPGTTADVIAAIWFAALRDGFVTPPVKEEIVAQGVRIRAAR